MAGEITVRRALDIGAVPGVFAWMASLVNRIGKENVFIVSKVGRRGERMWATVLQESGFYHQTGMQSTNVYWVRDRTGPNGKAPVVQQL